GNQGQLVADEALLEVSLQGVTAGAHEVRVIFNGNDIGTINFAGRERQSASFAFEPSILREGDNQVQFASATSGDISLTDYVRLVCHVAAGQHGHAHASGRRRLEDRRG